MDIESPLARAFVAFHGMINPIVIFCVAMVICYNSLLHSAVLIYTTICDTNWEKPPTLLYIRKKTPLYYILGRQPHFISSAVPSGSRAFLMPSCPSSVCPSVRLSVRQDWGGRGLSQKRFSNFSSFFGMKLLWHDINHISKDRFCWIALKVIFLGQNGQILPFLHSEAICSKTVQ